MSQTAVRSEPGAARAPRILNDKDVRVLALLAEGRSTSQIAAALSVSGNTARTRIRRVQARLDVPDRWAAVRAVAEATRREAAELQERLQTLTR